MSAKAGIDFGDDACLAAKYALEHDVVLERLIAGDDASTWGSAVTDFDALNESLDVLRGRMVTPNALSLRNVSIQQLAKAHTLPALVRWGMTWRHLVALGLTRKDLGSLDGELLGALGVTADDLLELRPAVRDIAALRLSAADMKRMGCDRLPWLEAVGYDAQSMRAHDNLSLHDWARVLGPRADWGALGVVDFDACVQMGGGADHLYSVVFRERQPRVPRPARARHARPVAALASTRPRSAMGRLTMPDIAAE